MPRKRKPAQHSGPHRYMRVELKSRQKGSRGEPYIVFRCMKSGCTHYVPRDLVVGNESECWRCGDTFQMTTASTYLKKPHCSGCTKGRPKDSGPSVDDVAANLDKLLGGV